MRTPAGHVLNEASTNTAAGTVPSMWRSSRSKALAAGAAVMLLVACSGSDDDTTTDDTTTSATTSVPTTVDGTVTSTTVVTTSPSTPGTDGPSTPGTDGPSTPGTDGGSTSDPSNISDAITALRSAAAEVPDGQPFDIEHSDAESGDDTTDDRVWEVKVASSADEFKIRVSLDGATVYASEKQDSPDDDVDRVAQAQVDMMTALQTAADAQPDALDEMEIDTSDDGTLVWNVEFEDDTGKETKVTVDATSGDIIR